MNTTRNCSEDSVANPEIQASIGSLLADETRIQILRELYAVRVSDQDSSGLSFSTLRRRVGVSDSGRFNYHLKELSGQLVRKVDGEYSLTPVAERLVRALEEPSETS